MFTRFLLLNAILLISNIVFAQYSTIKVEKQPESIEILQIDFREFSTLIYAKYTSPESIDDMEGININEKTYIQPYGTNKKYPLINSINLPIDMEAITRYMLVDYPGQEHHFILEFEKLPKITKFDIIEKEGEESAINLYGIEIDTTQTKNFMDIDTFIADYPVKEFGAYIKDARTISWVKANGITLTIAVQGVRQYGKYFQVDMSLQNLCGKPILFNINNIKAKGYILKDGEIFKTLPLDILSSYDYDKMVYNRQAWNNFLVAFGEGMAASNAGHSSSSTTYTGSSTTHADAYAHGFAMDNYGNSIYGSTSAYGSAYTTSYGKSTTHSYNGAAAYAAQQNAANKVANYANAQAQIRQQLKDGYAKNNTIENEVEYSGFFNIIYNKKIDNIFIEFTIDGIKFPFVF